MQSTFRQVLIHEHKSINPEEVSELWCPVLGESHKKFDMKAAHIFPYRLGEDAVQTVFGDGSANEMFSLRNGLILDSEVEEKFDLFVIAIVPAGPIESGRWKDRVLDNSIRKQKVVNQLTYESLDNQELAFKGNAHPAARYLYWHSATAVMKMAERKSTQGWLEEMGRNRWATPPKYIRQNMLNSLAERIGHCVPDDELHDHTIAEPVIPHLDDKMAAKVVMDAVQEDNSEKARYDPEFS